VTGVRSRAALVAERAGRAAAGGRTRCTTLRSAPPLTLRAAGGDLVHLVGSTAGPLGGDDLHLAVTVRADASLTVRSVAASVVLPGPTGAPSILDVAADVGPGATLRWLPEPTVVVRGCDHRSTTVVRLSPDARLVWREVVVLGRHDEPPGSLLQRLRVDLGGRPLIRNDLAVGPRWPASLGPGGLGGAGAVGTALVVGDDAAHLSLGAAAPGPRAAVLPLGGPRPAALVSVVAADALTVVTTLDAVLTAGSGV
jgi:urease accessory protein